MLAPAIEHATLDFWVMSSSFRGPRTYLKKKKERNGGNNITQVRA